MTVTTTLPRGGSGRGTCSSTDKAPKVEHSEDLKLKTEFEQGMEELGDLSRLHTLFNSIGSLEKDMEEVRSGWCYTRGNCPQNSVKL